MTATTIQFRFVAPTDTGGLPIDSYAVEYKEATQDWNDAQRRLWPASECLLKFLRFNSTWSSICLDLIGKFLLKTPSDFLFSFILFDLYSLSRRKRGLRSGAAPAQDNVRFPLWCQKPRRLLGMGSRTTIHDATKRSAGASTN